MQVYLYLYNTPLTIFSSYDLTLLVSYRDKYYLVYNNNLLGYALRNGRVTSHPFT